VIARTLHRRVVLSTAEAGLHRALRYLECAPEIAGDVPVAYEIQVQPHRDYFRILEPDGTVREQMTAAAVVHQLHRRLFALAIEERPESLVLHAACLRKGGRRLLLVGTEGAGKTTTTLRLMLGGYEIEGDENVFVDAHGVIARPRGMRVKEGTLQQLPQAAERIAQAPYLIDYNGRKIFNVDPRSFGGGWEIRPGSADFIFLARANHGGASSIRPLSPIAAAREIMAEIAFPPTGRGRAVSALARLTGRAHSYDLSLGDPSQAIALIDQVVIGSA
jgi:hypothetical protein